MIDPFAVLETLFIPFGGPPDTVIGAAIPAELAAFYALEGATMKSVTLYRNTTTDFMYDGLIVAAGPTTFRVMGGSATGDVTGVTELCRFTDQAVQVYGSRTPVPTTTYANGAHLNFRDGAILRVSTVAAQLIIDAGATITRNTVNARLLTGEGYAESNADLTLAVAVTDVPGATLTLTAGAAGAVYKVRGVFDFDTTVAASPLCVGELNLDGAALNPKAFFRAGAATDTPRATVTVQSEGTVGAGNHTWKLRANKSAAAGTIIARATHTTIEVSIYE